MSLKIYYYREQNKKQKTKQKTKKKTRTKLKKESKQQAKPSQDIVDPAKNSKAESPKSPRGKVMIQLKEEHQ